MWVSSLFCILFRLWRHLRQAVTLDNPPLGFLNLAAIYIYREHLSVVFDYRKSNYVEVWTYLKAGRCPKERQRETETERETE